MVVALGACSAGKSSLINTLMGKSVCKVGVRPTTDKISEVQIEKGCLIVDTPGLDAMKQEDHKKKALDYAKRASMAMLVINARQPFRESELPIIHELLTARAEVVVVINYWNHVTATEEQTDVLNYVHETISSLMPGVHPQIFKVNAKNSADPGMVELRKHLSGELSGSGTRIQGQKLKSARASIARDANLTTAALQSLRDVLGARHEETMAQYKRQLNDLETDIRHDRELKREKFQRYEAEIRQRESAIDTLESQKAGVSGGFLSNMLAGAATGLAADAATGGATMGLGALIGGISGALSGSASEAQASEKRDALDSQIMQKSIQIDRLRSQADDVRLSRSKYEVDREDLKRRMNDDNKAHSARLENINADVAELQRIYESVQQCLP